jgi:hypothetical protein
MHPASRSARVWLVGLFIVFAALPAEAKRFRNSFVSFELPTNWECSVEGTDWLCFSKFEDKTKEAIIVLTAKVAGPTDSLEEYERYLKQPHPIRGRGDAPLESIPQTAKRRMINNFEWVDAMHLNGEVENYYTRYVGTIKNGLAVMVTLSAHKAFYTKYSADFLRVVESLDIVAPADFLAGAGGPGAGGGTLAGGAPLGTNFGGGGLATRQAPKGGAQGATRSLLFGLGLIVAAIGVYLWFRSRKKKKMVKKVVKVKKPAEPGSKPK